VDLRIRAEGILANLNEDSAPLTAPVSGPAGGRPGGSKGWLAAAGLIGLALTLALLGLGVWLYARRRSAAPREEAPNTLPAESPGAEVPAEPDGTPGLVAFACAECGKVIKARPEQAGKRGKCPQCGKVVNVPAGPSS
jgi:hypothetical protein